MVVKTVRSTFPDDEATKARFWMKVDKGAPLGCWIWTADTKPYGYGQFVINRRRYRAHRVSFYWANGPLPDDKVIDHICRVRNCVNPAHLRLMSDVENVVIGVSPPAMNARRQTCLLGHQLDGANLYVSPRGWRYCRTCNRRRAKSSYEARRKPSWFISRDGECMADGCKRKRSRRGLCDHHYKQQLAGKPFTVPQTPLSRTGTCSMQDCDDPISRRRLCDYHYTKRRQQMREDVA